MTTILTLEDVCNILGISVNTGKKLAAQNGVNFPRSFKIGRRRLWRQDIVERYMDGDPTARA